MAGVFSKTAILAAALLLGGAAFAQQSSPVWKKPSQPVFIVTPNHYAQGFTPGGPTARFGDLIMIEIFNPVADPVSGPSYKPGQRYTLYSGGENVGGVKVEKVAPLQCNSPAAIVSIDGLFRFSKDTMALATNAPAVRTHRSARRPADDAERSTMTRLAAAELRKQGVPVTDATEIHISDLVATQVQDGGAKMLIGSAWAEVRGTGHRIFLIDRVSEATSAIAMSAYHKTTGVFNENDERRIRFADQLDLD